jgi:hypothetical protein
MLTWGWYQVVEKQYFFIRMQYWWMWMPKENKNILECEKPDPEQKPTDQN